MIRLSTSRNSTNKPLKLIIGFNKAVDQYTKIIKVPSHKNNKIENVIEEMESQKRYNSKYTMKFLVKKTLQVCA